MVYNVLHSTNPFNSAFWNVIVCYVLKKYPILYGKLSFVLCPSCSGDPPWSLKRCGMESSGQRPHSLNIKTKRIDFVCQLNNYVFDFYIFYDFFGIILIVLFFFCIFSYFLVVLGNTRVTTDYKIIVITSQKLSERPFFGKRKHRPNLVFNYHLHMQLRYGSCPWH